MRILFFICLMLYLTSCFTEQRKQFPVKRDSKSRVVVSYDSFVYRKYDTLGRLIELYGNFKRRDDDSNFRTFIDYGTDESVVTIKTCFLEDTNIKCIVYPNSRFFIEKYITENDEIFSELYLPIYDTLGNFINLKLKERSQVDMIPYKHVYPPQ